MSAALKDAGVSGVLVVLALFLAAGADPFTVTAADARVWLAAGLAAIIRTTITYLDPAQTAYGRTDTGP